MPLSISSFRSVSVGRERTLFALVLFLVLTISVEILLQEIDGSMVGKQSGTAEPFEAYSFWYAKANLWGPSHDIVLAGDSRVLVGLSPQVMSSALPGLRICNFAFNNAGLDACMLSRSFALLDPNSSHRMLVLGISPHSLTPNAAENLHYKELRRENKVNLLVEKYFSGPLTFFKRYSLSDLKQLDPEAPLNDEHGSVDFVYHSDGWLEANSDAPDPDWSLASYKEQFKASRVSQEIQSNMLEMVRDYTRMGVSIIGFRPPVPVSMHELENALSGFDETRFVDQFREAGGMWLTYAPGSYVSYDGSHLQAEAARNFSRKLAKDIARRYLEVDVLGMVESSGQNISRAAASWQGGDRHRLSLGVLLKDVGGPLLQIE